MVTRDSKSRENPAAAASAAAAAGAEEEHDFKRSGSSTAPVAATAGGTGGGGTESSYSIMNNTFRVDSRYSGLKAIGKGSFGFVCSASDEKQGKRVAIKKIHPMAQHVVDAKHVLREIRLMRYLGSHPNIVSLEDLFVCEHYDELYIVMELLDSDLHRIIQSPQTLGDAHHRYFMFQLLKGVKFLHDNRIIHRDLKPGNVLVTKNCQLRITDFGLARLRPMGRGAHPDDEVHNPMTEHVVTRWYRPPELMLCPDGLYGYAVDLWSVGCIFAELLGRHPLFPGKNFMDQLTLIFDVVGSPQPHEVAHIRNSQAKKFLESMQDRVKVPYVDLFSSASEQAVDLLEGLLVFDPPGRLSVDVALDHPYFQPLRRSDVKPDPEVAPGFEFDFESEPPCRVQLKQMILQEVESFQRAQRKRDRRARAAAAVSAESSSSSIAAAGGSGSGSGSSSGGSGKVGPAIKKLAPAASTAVDQDALMTEEQQQQQQQEEREHHHHQQHHQHQQQQHQQQQWLRRQRRQATVVTEATTLRGSGMRGGGGINGEDSEEGRGRERAPISAVRSAQVVSEAATVRAGLGSMRNSVQSHWGPVGTATAPPQEEYQSPPPPDNHAIGGGLKGASAAEPMDDDGDSTSNNRWWHEEKTKTNTHPHHHSHHHPHQHQHQQQQQQHQQPQASHPTNDYPRQQHNQQHHQPHRQQPQQARDAGIKWPATGVAVPLDSPVRIRRSTHSSSAIPGDGPAGARRIPSRKEGRDGVRGGEGARASAGGHKRSGPQAEQYQPHHARHHHQHQHHLPQQEQPVWGAKPAALRDVEDRFHRMNFDRTKHGRRTHDDMSDRSAGMRAPQR